MDGCSAVNLTVLNARFCCHCELSSVTQVITIQFSIDHEKTFLCRVRNVCKKYVKREEVVWDDENGIVTPVNVVFMSKDKFIKTYLSQTRTLNHLINLYYFYQGQ